MHISEPTMTRKILDDSDLGFWFPPEAPEVGLVDVARGRDVSTPTTVYMVPGDSASGVVGLLMHTGEFRPKFTSKVGQEVTLNQDGEIFTVETKWDGAIREPESETPIGYYDEEETQPVYQGRSRGLLLGNYSVTGELWKAIRKGGSFKLGDSVTRPRGRNEDTSPGQDNAIKLMEAA